MTKIKTFDCVVMKRQIQEGLLNEFSGVSGREKRRVMDERISSNPALRVFINKLKRVNAPVEAQRVGPN